MVGVVLIFLVLVLVAGVVAPVADAAPVPLQASIDADNGSGRRVTPGRSAGPGCTGDGAGAYWHYDYGTELDAGNLGGFPDILAEALVRLDLHSQVEQFPNVEGAYPDGTTAYLQGSESRASLLNDRGGVNVRLVSGSCSEPTLTFDGSTAAGSGTWSVAPGAGTGAYEGITGGGTFTMTAEVNPGADNALSLDLAGSLEVPAPSLDVEVVTTFWGGLGTDYLSRRVSVVYRVTNTGPGDAYGARVTALTNPTRGVSPIGLATPIPLGDLASGESTEFTVRHQLGLLSPCALVILGCRFDTRLTVQLPDALDTPHAFSETVGAQAPTLPPPL